jgi:sulfatase maturation enzyme AslB (radical SAM superfamily)
VAFVIATNLALLDEEILGFCAENQVHISTSLDGPQDLHNGNRRRPAATAGSRRWPASGRCRNGSAPIGSAR